VIDQNEYIIPENTNCLEQPISLLIKKLKWSSGFQIPKSNTSVALDYNNLKFPLKLRHWKDGDYFHPLGMKGRKKLSDFFVDKKIDLLEKQKLWILTSQEDVVWIVGYQIDDRFKITSATKNIVMISLKD
jgi:tRNA(Ile)-lysidine synthase